MPLRFLLDENLRGPLWAAIEQHNGKGTDLLDVVRVGDPVDLPLGTPDPDNLCWVEREGRLLITLDKTTMPSHLNQHLQAGRRSPGILILRPGCRIPEVVDFLVIAAYASDPLDWQDQVQYIP
jgi:hypothetical protein